MQVDAQSQAWLVERPRESPVDGVPRCSTLVDLLRFRALRQPDVETHRFLAVPSGEAAGVTHAELDRRARAIAVRLRDFGAAGSRVLLLFPAGVDYVCAFFGCLYGGAVVVPAFPFVNQPTPLRLRGVLRHAGAGVVLTTSRILAVIERDPEALAEAADVRWVTADDMLDGIEDDWEWPNASAESVAVQQTWTVRGRGAVLTHRDLLQRSALVHACLPATRHGVVWLPPYQDAALLGGILQPVYGGYPMTIVPPFAFLETPHRWLETISRTRATFTRAPDFAYELCVRKLRHQAPEDLDLSCLEVAFCGPGAMRSDTQERFAVAFERYGFRRSAFHR
jgi:acyl-CoA synthetase (AMP-forming)/AMP-acid ligase II